MSKLQITGRFEDVEAITREIRYDRNSFTVTAERDYPQGEDIRREISIVQSRQQSRRTD